MPAIHRGPVQWPIAPSRVHEKCSHVLVDLVLVAFIDCPPGRVCHAKRAARAFDHRSVRISERSVGDRVLAIHHHSSTVLCLHPVTSCKACRCVFDQRSVGHI